MTAKPVPETVRRKKREGKVPPAYYIDNETFYNALADYQARRRHDPSIVIPEYIGECFLKIADGQGRRRNFINWTWLDEMKADAVELMVRYIMTFQPGRSKNAFGYFSKIAFNAFRFRINKERKNQRTRASYALELEVAGEPPAPMMKRRKK
jgi:hypothetical protein